MAQQKIESYKKRLQQLRFEEQKENEMRDLIQRQQQEALPSLNRGFKADNKEEVMQVYNNWLQHYKKTYPEFKEDENTFYIDEHGNGCIYFKDPDAEEDFVRNLAANSAGKILDKGITIATFQDGKLIDPRSNQEFPSGGYSELVQQLDAGVAYKDISSPHSTAPTPFSTNPF